MMGKNIKIKDQDCNFQEALSNRYLIYGIRISVDICDTYSNGFKDILDLFQTHVGTIKEKAIDNIEFLGKTYHNFDYSDNTWHYLSLPHRDSFIGPFRLFEHEYVQKSMWYNTGSYIFVFGTSIKSVCNELYSVFFRRTDYFIQGIPLKKRQQIVKVLGYQLFQKAKNLEK